MNTKECRRCTAVMFLTEDDIETVLCEECEQIVSEYDPEHGLEEYRDNLKILIPGDVVSDPIILEEKEDEETRPA